jgi:glycosyltransferase 2 family protein
MPKSIEWVQYRKQALITGAVIFLAYAALLVFASTRELMQHLAVFPWLLLLPVIGLKMSAWFIRFWRWHYFVQRVGGAGCLKTGDSALIYLMGFSMVISPGKMGELVKAVFLQRKANIPFATGAPIVIAERVVDAIAVLLMVMAVLVIGSHAVALGGYGPLLAGTVLLLVVGLCAVQVQPLARLAVLLVERLPLLRRLSGALAEFLASSRQVLHPRLLIWTTLMGMLAHALDALSFALIIAGFGVPLDTTLYLQAVFITALTALIGGLSGVPNGAGVTEVSSSFMMTWLIAPAAPFLTASLALTIAIIEGFFHKWFRVLVGIVVALIFRNRLLESIPVSSASLSLSAHPQTEPSPV